MITDEDLKQVYASAPVTAAELEVISLTAPWFSRDYHLQNQVVDDVDVVLETGQTVTANYAPMARGQASSNSDLTYERTIIIQQVNDIIASEIRRYTPPDEKPTLTSRGYIIYRDGTVSSLKTAVVSLQVNDIELNEQGASITASTKQANIAGTGERNTIQRVPMQRGFV